MKIRSGADSQRACSCGSWLKHWEKFSGHRTFYCPVSGCLNQDLIGAHVQVTDGFDASWYICPLCNQHAHSGGELTIADTYTLVPADPKVTCERPSSPSL